MFFSRVRFEIDLLETSGLFHILRGDIYSAHQLIWKLFPDDQKANRDFLYRQEFEREQLPSTNSMRGLPVFYVVSRRKPVAIESLVTIETKPYEPILSMGMKLAFDTRVNPVVREKVERKNLKEWGDNRQARGLPLKGATKLRKYHDVIMNAKKAASKEGITDKTLQDRKAEEAVVEWFEDIGKTKGFVLTEQSSLETSGYRQESLRKVRNKTIKFSSVDLSGTIIVTDPKLFLELLYSGLGHARSFGCGMMMVRRL